MNLSLREARVDDAPVLGPICHEAFRAVGFFGHAVGETNEDLRALISEAQEFTGPGFHIPSRNSDLMRWCLANGFRIRQPMTLMSIGPYQEPAGAFIPSVIF